MSRAETIRARAEAAAIAADAEVQRRAREREAQLAAERESLAWQRERDRVERARRAERDQERRARRVEATADRARRRQARGQAITRWQALARRAGVRLRLVAPLLLVNALAVTGQVGYAMDNLSSPGTPLAARVAKAVLFAAALESIGLYVGWHAHKALLSGASLAAARLRVSAYTVAGVVGGINYAHNAGATGRPTAAAVAFGLVSLLSPWLWSLHSRRERYEALQRAGALDLPGAVFSATRWRTFPVRTWRARRWSIDRGVTDPAEAWRGYHTDRDTHRNSGHARRVSLRHRRHDTNTPPPARAVAAGADTRPASQGDSRSATTATPGATPARTWPRHAGCCASTRTCPARRSAGPWVCRPGPVSESASRSTAAHHRPASRLAPVRPVVPPLPRRSPSMTEQPVTGPEEEPAGQVVPFPARSDQERDQGDGGRVEVEPPVPAVLEPDEILPAVAPGRPVRRVRDVAPVLLRDRDARRQAGRQAAGAAGRAPVAYAGAVGRGAGRAGVAWWRWVSARDVRDSAHAAGRLHDKYAEIRSLAQSRLLWTAGGLAGMAGAVGIGDAVYGTPVVAVASGVLSAILALAGRRPAHLRPVRREPLRPAVTLTASVPLRYLEELIRAALVGIVPKVAGDLRVYGARQHPWGWTVTAYTAAADPGGDKVLAALERHLQVPAGAITPRRDRGNAAVTELRILSGDPLAGVGAPPVEYAPGSLTITEPLPVGAVMSGAELLLSLLRVHVGLIGGTGSGKSSTLWTLLDVLTACRDVVVWGVDLTGGPACHAWGDCVQEYATTPEQAEALLSRALVEARRRAAVLGERSRPSLDRPDDEPPGDENWTPTDRDPALVLVLDEFPALVDAGLMPLIKAILREGRKSAVTIVLASQRAGKGDLGDTTVREMLGVRIMLPCSAGDVDMLLPGGRAEGWRPDRLIPSDGVAPNDAGRFYLRAGGHAEPLVSAGYRLTLPEIHLRALARMRAGLPVLTGEAGPTVSGGVVPDELAGVLAAMDEADAAEITSEAAVRYLAGLDPDRWGELTTAGLADALRPTGARPATIGRGEFRGIRGYLREKIQAAISRCEAGETED